MITFGAGFGDPAPQIKFLNEKVGKEKIVVLFKTKPSKELYLYK